MFSTRSDPKFPEKTHWIRLNLTVTDWKQKMGHPCVLPRLNFRHFWTGAPQRQRHTKFNFYPSFLLALRRTPSLVGWYHTHCRWMVGYKCATKHEEASQEWIIPLLTETHLSNVVNVACVQVKPPKVQQYDSAGKYLWNCYSKESYKLFFPCRIIC